MKVLQDFNITEGKYVGQQRVSVSPVVNHCKDKKRQYVTYGCPICSKIATSYESVNDIDNPFYYDNTERFCSPSFSHGIKNCPRCGINLTWQ